MISHQMEIFRWMLVLSFFTDAIDGILARKYKVTSALGSTLDSVADDLTILMAVIGIIVFKPGFFRHEIILVVVLAGLYLIQTCLALVRYRSISSFHTILAKCATIFQGSFLILIFFLPAWPVWLFRVAAILTIVALIEEIILVIVLRTRKTDVKGLYWLIKSGASRPA
jgi:CDP-diacylglycerol--glycerol-3-phosphate 3-phosphatidyltransferase